jgi:tetratricopeptide (TPR) repeat protein
MSRLFLILLILFVCLLVISPSLAQEATLEAVDPAVRRAEAAAERAEVLSERAARSASDASAYLGIFESIGTFIGFITGLVIPALAVVGGFVGISRLNSAQKELSDASEGFKREFELLRDDLTNELRAKQDELDRLQKEINRSAELERDKSNKATLSLSLLPLGERQYRIKDFTGALNTYKRALSLDPHNPIIYYRLGYVYTQNGKLDEAIEQLQKALELDPTFVEALANLGYVLRRKAEKMPITDVKRGEMLGDAESKMRRALATSPSLVDEDGESWWGSLGGLHRRRGQIDDAIEAYTRARDVTKQASYPLVNLGLLYLYKRNREAMLETYRRAERVATRRTLADMTDFWSWADLLVSQIALGKITEANDTLESMFAAVPEGALWMVGMPQDTLQEMLGLTTPEHVKQIQVFINAMQNYCDTRQGVKA